MIAKNFEPKDYDQYVGLLKKRNREFMPLTFLPPTGIVVWEKERPIAFGFLTKTDTPIASIGDLVTDIQASGAERDNALYLLITSLEGKAKESGYTAACAATNHKGLQARYGKMGYRSTDDGLTIFVRFLCHSEGC